MNTPLVVHHLEMSRSHRVLWLLEELGIPYELQIHRRHPVTRLAPPELKAIHPLGKAPVITHNGRVIAESGAILEYLAETFPDRATGEWNQLVPAPGTDAHFQQRFWMHYAEGSLMNWLVMKLVFTTIPRQRMPFFVRPMAKALCQQVQIRLIDPNVRSALDFMEAHLATHTWFTGDALSLADVQMSFPVEAALVRGDGTARPHLLAYAERLRARPAYQRALAKGGPVLMKF